jgi:small redox-active disulfide protein 2
MVEVLGTGCAKCNKLEAMAKSVADKLGVPYEITHVRDINAIVQRGVMTTPALAIDGKVVVSGRVPSETEMELWLQSGVNRSKVVE